MAHCVWLLGDEQGDGIKGRGKVLKDRPGRQKLV